MKLAQIKLGFGAIAATIVAAPVHALAIDPASAEHRLYVQARLADASGLPEMAAQNYGRLLAEAPGDKGLALRAYRQALTAGDFRLASKAAGELDRIGALPADGTLLLLSDAVAAKDWVKARVLCDRIDKEALFSFLLPVIRGWVAVGAGDSNPLRAMDTPGQSQLANSYARDHRILIALVAGKRDEAVQSIRALIAQGDVRSLRLRLAVAAFVAKTGDRETAASLLDGRAPELEAARARLAAGKTLPGAIDDPADGLAELFTQLAVDVKSGGRSPMSLQLARLATYVAPANTGARIAAADLLSGAEYRDSALKLIDGVSPDDPLYDAARQVRTSILTAKGDKQAVLAELQRTAAQPGATPSNFADLGQILSDLSRPQDAAAAYGRAVAMNKAAGTPNWVYLFLMASTLDEAGQWPAAKTALAEANAIDPQQAIVLNYLGYGMLEHGEDLAVAQAYIERASALDPSDAAISDSLGWLYYKRGNYAGAIAALERAIVADPSEPVMHDHLGDAYWATGRRIEARYAWRAALVHAEPDDIARINRKLADGLDTPAPTKTTSARP
ncbi:tetratricopeptide repeat protein [Sphingomonas montanisoli]|uniref:Tetratricopeptide repeat protein n=1 Tax=Sphingomonas montanisoli TaxID=2606412 RepID=A0A5D9C841_9SPHN|nr:tetratricopeptide repeat protein [Sphingomonas montanisoli]TZG28048.1 tetratricopeptide repeat protein [Sphingomonas montanisoli]